MGNTHTFWPGIPPLLSDGWLTSRGASLRWRKKDSNAGYNEGENLCSGLLEEKVIKKHSASEPFKHDLLKRLKDPAYAVEFLNACLRLAVEENDPKLVLRALYDVAQARGMKKTADAAKMHRVTLHRMLNKGGNPEWNSLFRLLQATRLSFRFESTSDAK